MSSKRVTTSLVAIAALALAATTETTEAFAPTPVMVPRSHFLSTVRFAEETKESAFVPAENSAADNEESDEDVLSTVEMLGRGAAKVRRLWRVSLVPHLSCHQMTHKLLL